MIWNPTKGVKEAKTPAATPAATACGEPVSRMTRLTKYWNERANELRGHRNVRTLSQKSAGSRRLNSIVRSVLRDVSRRQAVRHV